MLSDKVLIVVAPNLNHRSIFHSFSAELQFFVILSFEKIHFFASKFSSVYADTIKLFFLTMGEDHL